MYIKLNILSQVSLFFYLSPALLITKQCSCPSLPIDGTLTTTNSLNGQMSFTCYAFLLRILYPIPLFYAELH